jgi:excisionase family DNA binding protein
VSITSTGISKHNGPLAYRINDAAAVAGLCRSQIYNLMRDGTLPFIEVGKIRMIRADDLRKLLKIEERG